MQRLADRLTHLGTWLPGDEGKIWVGAPLTVHRRCDQPMFDIAYDGLMICGTAPTDAEKFHRRYPSLPESKWINVASQDCQGHWIPAEGEQLKRILATLAELDVDISDNRLNPDLAYPGPRHSLQQRADATGEDDSSPAVGSCLESVPNRPYWTGLVQMIEYRHRRWRR